MPRNAATVDRRTYLPEGHEAEILDFVSALERTGGSAPAVRPALVDADGARTEIPEAMVEILRQVAQTLGRGMGVSVAPMNAMLTTQEAADYLGVSRPTLVRILERGEIPMERPGRHRYVRLHDLVKYQEDTRGKRREVLDAMARDAHASGVYDATDGPVPPMR